MPWHTTTDSPHIISLKTSEKVLNKKTRKKIIHMQALIDLYKSTFGAAPSKVESLPKAGSNRQYVRIYGSPTVIGVIGNDVAENRTFIHLARHFDAKNLPVPAIYAVSTDSTCYLQQDLGNRSLYSAIAEGRNSDGQYSPEEITLLKRTIRLLPHVQIEGADGLDFSCLLEPVCFDVRAAMFDLNYFKYCFFKTTDIPVNEVALENDLLQFASDLVDCCGNHPSFLYRDFQGRNIMLDDNDRPFLIDFQGGQRGPLHYDVASFLWQASAKYPQRLRDELIDDYMDELSSLITFDRNTFRRQLMLFVLFRLLQVLGAYGLRGYVERKKYFLQSIPHAIASLRRLLLEGIAAPYPILDSALKRMVALPRFNTAPVTTPRPTEAFLLHESERSRRPLVVRVFSFSYKKGIPTDTSGNGGGYVFDCRSTHNPGRYEPYKHLTGLDEPVIRFLEDDGEILTFLHNIYNLADAHCQRYIERGFSDLMFSFGCTGGQHRSVYSAQHLAEHLNRKFGIEVHIEHREQGIASILPPSKS